MLRRAAGAGGGDHAHRSPSAKKTAAEADQSFGGQWSGGGDAPRQPL